MRAGHDRQPIDPDAQHLGAGADLDRPSTVDASSTLPVDLARSTRGRRDWRRGCLRACRCLSTSW
jgi:hypothetical protein